MKLNSRCKKLAKDLCANFFQPEGCYIYENDSITCIYDLNEPLKLIRCAWFEQAVLPTESVLEVEYWNTLLGAEGAEKQIDYCQNCKKEIVKTSVNQKYCEKCAAKKKKQSTRDSVQQSRKTRVM